MSSIHEAIQAVVRRHYEESDKALPLSELGTALRKNGSWPPAGDIRPLGKIVDELQPEIKTLRDPNAKAFVAIFPADKEDLVSAEIARRSQISSLAKISRPVILAFCLANTEGKPVYIKISSPHRYTLGYSPGDDYVLIEENYRFPGLYIDNVKSLDEEDGIKLAQNINLWASHHKISIEKLYPDEKTPATPVPSSPASQIGKGENALERLYAAQPDGVGERIVMPFDIAVYLSRLP